MIIVSTTFFPCLVKAHHCTSLLYVDVFRSTQKAFSVLLSNGAIVTLHYERKASHDLCWGLKHQDNQIMMPYPSCGMGIFHSEDTVGDVQAIACCMRSGSTMMFPVGCDSSFKTSNEVISYNIPLDAGGIDDDSVRYAQGFAAGYIRVRTWGLRSGAEHKNVTPVIFHAWPGGVIDCYACHTPESSTGDNRSEKVNDVNGQLFRTLLSNGALKDLLNLLSLDHSNPQPGSLLQKASEEYKACIHSDDELLTNIVKGKIDGVGSIQRLLQDLITGREIL